MWHNIHIANIVYYILPSAAVLRDKLDNAQYSVYMCIFNGLQLCHKIHILRNSYGKALEIGFVMLFVVDDIGADNCAAGAAYPGGVRADPAHPLLNPSTTHKIKNALNALPQAVLRTVISQYTFFA